jgi:hypothetical protein
MEDTNDAQGTRDRQIQYIFQHEQQHAVKKIKCLIFVIALKNLCKTFYLKNFVLLDL